MILISALILFLNFSADAKVPCDPASFHFVNSPRKTEAFGTYTFKISNKEEIGCALSVSYDWSLYRINAELTDLTEIPKVTKALLYPGISKTMVNYVDMDKIPEMNNGLPRWFVLKVKLIPDPSYYPSYRMWLFGPDVGGSNELIISGGKERNHFFDGTSLWLNATGTDGDELLANLSNPVWECLPPFKGMKPPNTLKWEIPENYLIENITHTCKLTVDLPSGQSKSVSQIIHISPIKGLPQIEIRCRQNCEPAVADKEIILECYCHSNCETGQFDWTVHPYAESYMQASSILPESSSTKSVIKFNANTFKASSTMDFIASLEKATANLTIHFVMQKPELQIICIENCDSYDPKLETKFQVNCTSDCSGLEYIWESRPSSFKPWSLNAPTNDILTFAPDSFPKGTSVKLRVLAGRTEAFLEFQMGYGPVPDIKIECVSNCVSFDPRMPLELKAVCNANCTGEEDFTYYWTHSVPRPGFHWYEHTSNGNRTLIIPADTYRDTDVVEFWVYGGNGNDSTVITFHIEKPQLNIVCVENCEVNESSPNPQKPVKLKVECSAECNYGPYEWWMEPPPGDVDYNVTQVGDNGTFFTIPAYQYKEGDKVEVTVAKGTGTTSISVPFVLLKPKLEIRCLKNCIQPSDPMQDTVLDLYCMEFCEGILYEWRPVPKPDLWYEYFALGKDNRTLTIKKGAYNNSENVDVGVFTKNDVEVHLNLSFDSPSAAVFRVVCAANCNSSWTLYKTVLKVECSENCQNAEYEWSIQPELAGSKWAEKIEMTRSNTTLTITPFTFKHGDIITFTVKRKQNQIKKANEMAEVTIEFEEVPPKLTITCESNGCNTTVNRLESVLLIADCVKYCNEEAFVWEIIPLPPGFDWDANIIRGVKNKTIKIKPDAFKNNDNITFTLFSGSSNTSVFIAFKDPIQDFIIVCEDNCKPSNPYKSLTLRLECIMNCEHSSMDSIQWTFTPAAESVVYGPKTVKVLADTFKDGDIVTVTAKSGGGNYDLKISLQAPAPDLDIICVRNCEFDTKLQTILRVSCIANCHKNMEFKWEFSPKPEKQETYLAKNDVVLIPEGSFDEKVVVNVTVVSGKARFSTMLMFQNLNNSVTEPPFECDSLQCPHLSERRIFKMKKNESPIVKLNYGLFFLLVLLNIFVSLKC